MIYPIKTLSQLPLILKGFRKEKGLTQATVAERLGITQQSYAYFEANPATATLERLFIVLRMLDVEISLNQLFPVAAKCVTPPAKLAGKRATTVKAIGQQIGKKPNAVATGKSKPSVGRIVAPTKKKESW